jgi:hypothetical protein
MVCGRSFRRIDVDPKNTDRLFKMGFSVNVPEDGGKSFSNAAGGSHGDWHGLDQPGEHQIYRGGDDAAFGIPSTAAIDGKGRTARQPVLGKHRRQGSYQVYGGLQDNSSWWATRNIQAGPRSAAGETLRWGRLPAFPDPSDPNFAYAEYQGGHIAQNTARR